MSAVEQFPILLSDAEEESSAVAPCFSHEGINVCLLPARRLVVYVSRSPPLAPRNPHCAGLAIVRNAPGPFVFRKTVNGEKTWSFDSVFGFVEADFRVVPLHPSQ